MFSDVSKEHAASIFKAEDGYSKFLHNIVKQLQYFTGSHQKNNDFYILTAFIKTK
jgi:hypothetical protein